MHIQLNSVSVRFPVYDSKQRSIKQTLLGAATGGTLVQGNRYAEVDALKNISLDIREGDRVALLGHNGAGKTTLLRVIAGVYAPTAGTVSVQGHTTSLLDAQLGMDPDATGIENLYLRGLFLGLKGKQIKELTDDIVAFSELGEFIEMPVRTYSSGMVLRLAFSISTSVSPEILVMDEWLSVGDDEFKKKAEKRLRDYVNRAGILVLSTHDDEHAKAITSRTVYLEHGEIKSRNGWEADRTAASQTLPEHGLHS